MYNLRTVAPIIYGKPAEYFAKDYPRGNLEDFERMLKFPGDKRYPALTPILYPNLKKDATQLFRNTVLLKVSFKFKFGWYKGSSRPFSRL
jgi:hypothetical protein